MRKFIVLEGLDYAGKSTLAKALVEKINSLGKNVKHVSMSSNDNIVLSAIKQTILESDYDMDIDTQALLFASSISYMLNNHIVPALQQGSYVICERFTLSNRVYQEQSLLSNVVTSTIESIKKAELTIILDITPDEYLKRQNTRGNPDRLESVDIDKVIERRTRYLSFARQNPDVKILDGNLDTNEQVDYILTLIKQKRLDENN